MPKKFNKTLFLTYEEKIKYIFRNYNIDEFLYNFADKIILETSGELTLSPPASLFLNILYYIDTNNMDVVFKENSKLPQYTHMLTEKVFNYFIDIKKMYLKNLLKDKYNIVYNDIIQTVDTKNNTVICQNRTVKLVEYEGAVFIDSLKSFILDEEVINTLIDYVGVYIEKENINERIS